MKLVCKGVPALQKDRSDFDSRAGIIAQLVELLASVEQNGEKAVVFSQSPSQFDKLEDFLMNRLKSELDRPIEVLTLTGQHSGWECEETERKFTEVVRFPVRFRQTVNAGLPPTGCGPE